MFVWGFFFNLTVSKNLEFLGWAHWLCDPAGGFWLGHSKAKNKNPSALRKYAVNSGYSASILVDALGWDGKIKIIIKISSGQAAFCVSVSNPVPGATDSRNWYQPLCCWLPHLQSCLVFLASRILLDLLWGFFVVVLGFFWGGCRLGFGFLSSLRGLGLGCVVIRLRQVPLMMVGVINIQAKGCVRTCRGILSTCYFLLFREPGKRQRNCLTLQLNF